MNYILQPQLVAENVVVYQFFSEKIIFLESCCVKTSDNFHAWKKTYTNIDAAKENSSIGLQLYLPKVSYGLPHTYQTIAEDNRIGHNAKSVHSFKYIVNINTDTDAESNN